MMASELSTTDLPLPPNLMATSSSSSVARHRQRIGGGGVGDTNLNAPYRDDPSIAPPRLESFLPSNGGGGGYGGISGTDMEKSKDRSWLTKVGLSSCCYRCWDICCHSTRKIRRSDSSDFFKYSLRGDGGAGGASTTSTSSSIVYYYEDTFNDLSWSCTFGTLEENGIWLNRADPAGTLMAILVWVLMSYSALTMIWLGRAGGIPPISSMIYTILVVLTLACHMKTSLTDPGAVPNAAVPTAQQRGQKLSMCSQCQTFKPPFSHHCRICQRCISRMDHHCPWMNNCVGAANLKHFLLFLIYTWMCSSFSLVLLAWNYFFCAQESCVFHIVLVQLVRIMAFLSVATFLFTSSMLMNVIYGIMTGIGTIDRLKKKANNTLTDSVEEPIPLSHIFGIGPLWQWPFPLDPIFHDYDVVMGFSTPQRLLREQMREQLHYTQGSVVGSTTTDLLGMPV